MQCSEVTVVQQLKFIIIEEIDMKYAVESFEKEFGISPVEVLGFLKQIKQDRVDENFGICFNLSDLTERKYKQLEYKGYDIVEEFSKEWKHHSGNVAYPVPRSHLGEDLWEGDQLKYRLDLIDYIIGQLKEIK